jgi:hypothetical protein
MKYRVELGKPSIELASGVVERTFKGIPADQTRKDTADHLVGDLVHSFYSKSDLVGFATYKTAGSGRVLYLAGMVIDSDHQGHGLGTSSVKDACLTLSPATLCAVTRNAVMARTLAKHSSHGLVGVYPFTRFSDVDIAEMCEVAGVPISTAPVHKGRYPEFGLLGGDTPNVGNRELDQYFSGLQLCDGILVGVKV